MILKGSDTQIRSDLEQSRLETQLGDFAVLSPSESDPSATLNLSDEHSVQPSEK